jgi:hypothetical protein
MLQVLNNDGRAQCDRSSDYMSFTLGETKLLAIRSEIHLVEPVNEISQIKKSVLSTGRIELDGRIIPVYCFTEDLEIEQTISIEKPVCIVFKHNKYHVGILCTEASPCDHQIIKVQALPECMMLSAHPIIGLCLSRSNENTQVSYLISAKALLEYIDEYNTSRI